MNWDAVMPIILLGISNTFMTFAWYGQLKFPNAPLWILIPASWGIAFFEYCFACRQIILARASILRRS